MTQMAADGTETMPSDLRPSAVPTQLAKAIGRRVRSRRVIAFPLPLQRNEATDRGRRPQIAQMNADGTREQAF